MVRGSWPISGHPCPRSLLHGPRTRMPTDESRASNQRSSTRPRRWFSRRAGPRHRHRRAFSWRVRLGLEIVDGFLEELELGLVIVEFFCLLDPQLWPWCGRECGGRKRRRTCRVRQHTRLKDKHKTTTVCSNCGTQILYTRILITIIVYSKKDIIKLSQVLLKTTLLTTIIQI